MTAPWSSPPRRRSVFADRLLEFPDFVFSDGRETVHHGRWGDFFGARTGPSFGGRIVVEIGCNDEELRAKLRERGIRQAKRFSWESMAKQTVDVYNLCAASGALPAKTREAT